MKVHIIGLPSAGKSTLAAALAAHVGIAHHDLDPVAFVDDRWTPRPPPERGAKVAAILAEPNFVTEGAFLGWTAPLLEAADHIIWLDPPLRVLISRHLGRFGLTNPWDLGGRIRFQVLSYSRPPGRRPAKNDPHQTRSGIARELRPFASKVFRIRRAVTAEEVVATLKLRRPA